MSSQSYFFNPQDDRMSCAGSGLQLPRLSSTQRLALTVGVNDAGLQVFDTTLQAVLIWNGTSWATSVASFTTAQLMALSASESAALGIAYCTDCLSTRDLITTPGDFAYYNGVRWVNAYDRCPLTTLLAEFSIWKFATIYAANGIGTNYNPIAGNLFSVTSGTGASLVSNNFPIYDGRATNAGTGSTGTTATGTGRNGSSGFPLASGASQRILSCVIGWNSFDSSGAPDTWHIRTGIETFQITATAAVQADMGVLLYDKDNILGFGSTGDNLFAVIRGNSTTFDFIDSGISNSTPHYEATTMEVVGANQVKFTVATARSNVSNFQVVAQRTVQVSGANLQGAHCFAKATGTNAKLSYKTSVPTIYAYKVNALVPTTFLS